MKKIIVAGAGHGGLVCAYLLAKNGYEVTVLEKKAEKEVGWDWHDMMLLSVFDKIGMPRYPREYCSGSLPVTYFSPDKKTRVSVPANRTPDLVYVDRRELIKYLLSEVKKAGAEIKFGAEVRCALWQNNRVAGIIYRKNGKDYQLHGDLTVDAAGIDSPVRASLPKITGIENIIPENKIFFTYRAYFERTSKGDVPDPNCVYLFHCRNKGMDWAIVGEDFVDFLVGSFGKINSYIIDNALSDFLSDYATHTNGTLTRGGTVAKIPLTKTLSRFIANGYAAVGDSALMTETMSGSGITLSMDAGRILAETVIKAKDGELNSENLWEYQYRYLQENGFRYLHGENMRNLLTELSPDDINGFMNASLIGEKELETGSIAKMTAKEALYKIKKALPYFYMIPGIIGMVKKNQLIPLIQSTLPPSFNEKAVKEWEDLYNKL